MIEKKHRSLSTLTVILNLNAAYVMNDIALIKHIPSHEINLLSSGDRRTLLKTLTVVMDSSRSIKVRSRNIVLDLVCLMTITSWLQKKRYDLYLIYE